MKTNLLLLFSVFFLCLSCGGGGASASKLANEVCDCYQKANAMDPSGPERAKAQDACLKKQGENWTKVKDDQKKADEFNKIIGDCGKKMIEESVK